MVPVLAVGFDDLTARVQLQNKRAALYKQKCDELDIRLDALIRKQQTETEQSLRLIRQKYQDLGEMLLKVMRSLESIRFAAVGSGAGSSGLYAVAGNALNSLEEQLRTSVQSLAKKLKGDQALRLRVAQLSDALHPSASSSSNYMSSIGEQSIFTMKDAQLSGAALQQKHTFLGLLEEQQKALKLLIDTCLAYDKDVLDIQRKLNALRQTN